ncbi:MAG: FG-GAP-like repeat-containing protein [Dysgonamonadaceae bacterium]|jgi:hypothetical protein|nr:FG-GAP-like repeat-containing protein [Dysgonamonadaceae bacterium]
MKHFFTLFVFAFALTNVQAQFVDFGSEIWKGIVAAGDIDNDGDLDVIVSGNTQNHGDNDPGDEAGAILINGGVGNFTVQAGNRVITAGNGGNIHFGDIDGDGDLDVIFAGWGTTNAVKAGIALNDGNGVFTLAPAAAYPINPATKITSCGFADFDLNGLLDYYFFGNNVGNCIIYFQQPNGSFVAKADAIQATQRYGNDTGSPVDYNFNEAEVTVIDFNRDGYPDMWINAADLNAANAGEQTQRFSYLFKNDGFGLLTQYSGAIVPFKKGNGDSSWGDINGDGYPDMLLHGDGFLNSGEDSDRMWRVFENQDGLSIAMRWEREIARQGSMANGSLIVDWDNDGKLDLFTGGWNGTLSRQEIALFLGDNPAQFTFTRSALSDTYFQGASEQGLLTADLNGDNKVELLLSGFCGLPLSKRAAGYMVNQSATASVPPAAPTNLNAVIDDSEDWMITFSWNAPASEAGKYGTTYNLALKNTSTGKWLYNPMAVTGSENNGRRTVGGRMGNVFSNTSYELYNLPAGNYEWTVQAINGAYLGGAFAGTKTFTVAGETGLDKISKYAPKVYTSGKNLVVKGSTGAVQSLKVYSIGGVTLASTTFTGNTEVELPVGVYLVELTKAGDAPYRTKVLINK